MRALLLTLAMTVSAVAENITFAWDSSKLPDGKPDLTIANYVVMVAKGDKGYTQFYPTNGGAYQTTKTTDIQRGPQYRASVYAIDINGNWSGPSNVIGFEWDRIKKKWALIDPVVVAPIEPVTFGQPFKLNVR